MNPAAPFSAWERFIAARYLRAKRSQGGVALISVISFVAITLAVGALVIVMSIMNGFRSDLIGKIMGFNGHVFVIAGPMTGETAVNRIRHVPGVVSAMPVVEGQVLVQGPAANAGAIVRGLSPADVRATAVVAAHVKPPAALRTFGQGEDGGDQVLLGARLAENLGVEPGDDVTLISPNGAATAFGTTPVRKTYTVGGVFSVGMSEYDQGFIYMPIDQAELFFGRASADYIEVKVADPDKAPELKPAIAQAAAVSPELVSDWTQKNSAFFGAVQVERNAMRLILMFIIAIAALNIISGLVMLVKNKGKDIAILRTMGATQGAILRIFFLDGAAIGVAGTVCGLIFGIVFCANIGPIQGFIEWVTGTQVFNPDVYFLSHVPAKIDWGEVVGVSIWTLGASFAATLLPAWQASRLDPVEALRYE
ncbi:MAG TPA: lipoprotein-releasing ABC transporter permease subunit [Caulobacteraceae bacterium]|nr:lipoprotein-releasing ABC transporter permease subunit [Caulobacteraceae bacterium]